MWLRVSIFAIAVILVNECNLVQSAPLPGPARNDKAHKATPKNDEVMQLEDLKQKLVGVEKVVPAESVLHGTPAPIQSTQSDHENRKMIGSEASPESGVEPGSEPGQEQLMIDNLERRSETTDLSNKLETSQSNSISPGVQYSPRDMAEYIFWTGDEKSVTMAIEEFLGEKLLTREEAIVFLQQIKMNLDYLQLHYAEKQRFYKERKAEMNDINAMTELAKEPMEIRNSPRSVEKNDKPESDDCDDCVKTAKDKSDNGAANHNSQVMIEKKALDMSVMSQVDQDQIMTGTMSEDDYDEIIERLKVADFLYTEYSLEEVIYQLAKVMFSQSLTKGSTEAHDALRKFTNFLAGEAERGRISTSLEKKVLDVLIASLTDTLSEHPHLLAAPQSGKGKTEATSDHTSANEILQQLLMLNTATRPVSMPARPHQSTLAKARELNQDTEKKTEIQNTPVKSN